MSSQVVSQTLGVGRGCLDKEQTELQPDRHLSISLKKPLKRPSCSEILSHLHSSPSLCYLRWLVSPPPQSFFPFSCSFFLISAVSASALSFPSAVSPTGKQSFTGCRRKQAEISLGPPARGARCEENSSIFLASQLWGWMSCLPSLWVLAPEKTTLRKDVPPWAPLGLTLPHDAHLDPRAPKEWMGIKAIN